MREINCTDITNTVKEMCISAAHELSPEMEERIRSARNTEPNEIGQKVIDDLIKNIDIAREEMIPICQDTGMAVFFVEIGQEVHICGGSLKDAINEGVRRGYIDGYLRKSVVSDPIERVNTGDNTPAIIHYDIVEGDAFNITLAPKGFGSENMSRVIMLKPADGLEGVKKAVVETILNAGPNACPPIVAGVGIGGDFEKAAIMAKHALATEKEEADKDKDPYIKALEEDILAEVNASDIGPAGLGGKTTMLYVNIEKYPTHIAGLPVAVNICCHANRHIRRSI